MMWELVVSPSFRKSFRRLHPDIRKAVLAFIEAHQDGLEDPARLSALRKLLGTSHYFRLRFGGHRVGVELDPTRKWVISISSEPTAISTNASRPRGRSVKDVLAACSGAVVYTA